MCSGELRLVNAANPLLDDTMPLEALERVDEGAGILLARTPAKMLRALCAASGAVGYIRPVSGYRTGLVQYQRPSRRAWAQVDETALLHNLDEMRKLLAPGCEVMAVVKADAYGHGAVRVARCLYARGVRAFAVATLAEGIALRKSGLRGSILVLGYTAPQDAWRLWLYRLTQAVVDAAHAAALGAERLPLRVHLKIDTGMHRLGFSAADTEAICDAYTRWPLRVTGIYTHLSCADSLAPEDVHTSTLQTERFFALLEQLTARGIAPGKTHIQSSSGVLNFPGVRCDYARIGLALYGCPAGALTTVQQPALWPVLALYARVAHVQEVPAGEYVGYGRTYCCAGASRLATVTMGYADGIARGLQGGYALIQGARAPIVGRISMDQLCVCVDGIPGVCAGDRVTLLGREGEEQILAQQLAAWCGTIPNELLARIGPRVTKEYLKFLF